MKEPQPVKLIVGLLAADPAWLRRGFEILCGRFGPPDAEMAPVPFTHTRYYAEELGPEPTRAFASFRELVSRETLPTLKLWARERESELAVNGKRSINFDPGYLTPGQFFLASTKDQRQRVYVRDGIYVEPTLYFRAGEFHSFEWTYPDYRGGAYFEFLKKARRILLQQLRDAAGGEPVED